MSFSVIARLVRPPHPFPPIPPAALFMNVRRQQCDQICQNFATLAKFNKSLMILLRVYLANIWQNFESTLVMLMGIFLLFQMVDIDQRVLPSGHTEWSKHESARALSWLNIFAGAVLLLLLLRPMHAIKQCQAEREREKRMHSLSLTHSHLVRFFLFLVSVDIQLASTWSTDGTYTTESAIFRYMFFHCLWVAIIVLLSSQRSIILTKWQFERIYPEDSNTGWRSNYLIASTQFFIAPPYKVAIGVPTYTFPFELDHNNYPFVKETTYLNTY